MIEDLKTANLYHDDSLRGALYVTQSLQMPSATPDKCYARWLYSALPSIRFSAA